MILHLNQFVPFSLFSVVNSSNLVNMLGGIVCDVEVVGDAKVVLDGLGIGLLLSKQ